ncbi:MAG TPA: DUF488 domain-containing protein [Chitinophagaceae bacterium]|jgi:uncharacterized protein (DUF488 family)|nr:DUF488 domain-containing protein [Chitinophagaceae bacterium]
MNTGLFIYTIGHSNKPWDAFLEMLHAFGIKLIADVRSLPGSRKYPHFDQDQLMASLPVHGIRYQHFPGLGGRRNAVMNTKNTGWRNPSFRGYADYMETEAFRVAVHGLQEIAVQYRTAYMCSEAVWWRCHRSMISDYLKVQGWKVLHILEAGKSKEHPFTAPARIIDGNLTYTEG